jgi:hypothetical protein
MSRVDINKAAVEQLLQSQEVSAALQKECDRIAAAANTTLPEGDGYAVSSRTGRHSPPSSDRVYTASAHAMNSNAKHNTLLRVTGNG